MTDLTQEFLGQPEGTLRDGSLVVRPSLRAAFERFIVALAGVSVFFVPIFIGLALGTEDRADEGIAGGLNLIFGLVVPIGASMVPAIQLAFTRYIFDDEGIRERVQLLNKTEKRVKWEKVTALQHRRTVLDKLLGVERLDVIAYGARGTTLHLVGLRDAGPLRGMVARQMRAQASVKRLFSND